MNKTYKVKKHSASLAVITPKRDGFKEGDEVHITRKGEEPPLTEERVAQIFERMMNKEKKKRSGKAARDSLRRSHTSKKARCPANQKGR